MLRDHIERFKYRFSLWWHEQHADRLTADGSEPSRFSRPLSETPIYSKSESIPAMVFRHIQACGTLIVILLFLGRLIFRFAPSWRFVVSVSVLILIALCIFTCVVSLISEWRAKKQRALSEHDI
jgi:magnesium-transporting ATPase (P-type)